MKRSRAQIQEKTISTWNNHDEHEEKLFNFVPALHIQRKRCVLDNVMEYVKSHYLERSESVPTFKMIDVGCEKGAFFQFFQTELIGLKNKFNTEYTGIDISEFTLTNDTVENLRKFSMGNASDLRSGSVSVKLLNENVLYPSIHLDRPDVLVMIEVIEHIKQAEVDDVLPHSIFGAICPNIAIITTPNADFNIVFGMKSRLQFRHWDHKFEWTRKEFKTWCEQVVKMYPDYAYTIEDIGTSIAYPKLGGGSQMAVFSRIYAQPFLMHESLSMDSKIVYEKENLFLPLSEYDCIRKYLNYQMSLWAVERQVVMFEDLNNDTDSCDSMKDFDDQTSDLYSNNLGLLDFDDNTGNEIFIVTLTVIERIIKKVFPHADIDVERMIEECCMDNIYFKYDQDCKQIIYEIKNFDYDDEDEEAYLSRITTQSNNSE